MNLFAVNRIVLIIASILLLSTSSVKAFSVLAHEAIVDAAWDISIKPLLKKKFPDISGEDYKSAHAYAYGGCLMADMGYMPGGNPMFTDLLHYVRSGDFVTNLLNEAKTSDEYAFALGALSHYMADKYGHSLATNKTVPLLFPKLRAKFGNTVTYDDNHTSHSRVEFTYDVLQVGRGNYASPAYHDFIGFQMAVPLLEKVFKQTYGENLTDYFGSIKSKINMYRWGVRSFFPRMIRNASKSNKSKIQDITLTNTSSTFKYKMSRHMFNLEFGKERNEGNFLARVMADLVLILPKIGPLKKLKFIDPTPQGEKLFDDSFKTIVLQYNDTLAQLQNQQVNLPDIDFDTGKPTVRGEYHLTDETYAELLVSLQKTHFMYLTPNLKENILSYYHNFNPDTLTGIKPKNKKKLIIALKDIKKVQPLAAGTNMSAGQ